MTFPTCRRCMALAATTSRRSAHQQKKSWETLSDVPAASSSKSPLKSSLLSTAAQVSAKASQSFPPPPRFQPSHLPQPRRRIRQSDGSHGQHGDSSIRSHDMSTSSHTLSPEVDIGSRSDGFEHSAEWLTVNETEVPEEESDALSSSLRRKSPAARYGMTSNARFSLPINLTDRVQNLITASDKAALKADYDSKARQKPGRNYSDAPSAGPDKTTPRTVLAHYALKSPERYAAIRSVLAEVRKRLEFSGPEGIGPEAWFPTSLIEWDCQGAEGLWAFKDVFCGDETDSTPSMHFEGSDADFRLLHVGADLAAQSGPTPSAAWQSTLTEEKGSLHVEFEGRINATFSPRPLPARRQQGGGTVLLSAFKLSRLNTDADRQEYVEKMWKHSEAEVLVIIDEATPRGFASVASARSQLLLLGNSPESVSTTLKKGKTLRIGGQTFYEQSEEDVADGEVEGTRQQAPAGAHVVAPCPHDQPCPLLHPFVTLQSAAELGGKTARSFSRGLPVCEFSQTLHLPRYTRLAQRRSSAAQDGQVKYSYVVVRRGPRPSFSTAPSTRSDRQSFDGALESVGRAIELEEAAARTKMGDIESIRRGEAAGKTQESIRTLATLGPEGESTATAEDPQAQEELLKMMPEILKDMQKEAEDGEDTMTDEQLEAVMDRLRSQSTLLPSDDESVNRSEALEVEDEQVTESDLQAMRLEAYSWPRLIKAPLKKGGHVTFDACCASGAIERFTIAKSAGKQPYQDARKAQWGDLFPHPSKNGKSTIQVPAAAVDDQGNGLFAAQGAFTNMQTSVGASKPNTADDLDGLFTSDEEALKELEAKEGISAADPTELGTSTARSSHTSAPEHGLIGPDALALSRGEKNASNIQKYKGKSKRSGRRTTVEYITEPSVRSFDGTPRVAKRSSRKRSKGDYDV